MVVNLVNCGVGLRMSQLESFILSKKLRIWSIGLAASFGIILTTHLGFLLDVEEFGMIWPSILQYYLLMAAGLSFYLSRVPERYFPGRFDILFQSHQLWHLCGTAAIFILYRGWLNYYSWKIANVSCEASL